MDELDGIKKRMKRKRHMEFIFNNKSKTEPIDKKWISRIFTRVLISTIFVLISTIYIKWDKNNLQNYKKEVFETNLSFTAINNWYEKNFGSVLPIQIKNQTAPVNKTENDYQNVEAFHDGFVSTVKKGSAIQTMNSGIVVFIGEKETYGNVVIIQGIDGVDVWYGNITNVNLSLYDYVNKNTLLGETYDDKIYFVFQKDGAYLNYDEYTKEI